LEQASRIIQWNMRSFKNKLWAVHFVISIFHYKTIILQETWNFYDFKIRTRDYTYLEQHRDTNKYGGIAIGIHHSLAYRELQFPNLVLTPQTQNKGIHCGKINVIIFYSPPKVARRPTFGIHFFNIFSTPIIMGGDVNTRHQLLGGNKINTAGTNLIKSLLSSSYLYLNDGTSTRITLYNQVANAPDVTLATPTLYLHANWEVYYNALGSDHYPIIITVAPGNSRKSSQIADSTDVCSPYVPQ